MCSMSILFYSHIQCALGSRYRAPGETRDLPALSRPHAASPSSPAFAPSSVPNTVAASCRCSAEGRRRAVAAVDAKAAKGGLHSHRRPEFGLAYPGEEGVGQGCRCLKTMLPCGGTSRTCLRPVPTRCAHATARLQPTHPSAGGARSSTCPCKREGVYPCEEGV